jgi:hypothetical protein
LRPAKRGERPDLKDEALASVANKKMERRG